MSRASKKNATKPYRMSSVVMAKPRTRQAQTNRLQTSQVLQCSTKS
ncbi:AP-1 complex subunit beta-1 [Venturia inaequalis]|nr:AP-1 complex subunit beta-1 [Venturia inaequalis]